MEVRRERLLDQPPYAELGTSSFGRAPWVVPTFRAAFKSETPQRRKYCEEIPRVVKVVSSKGRELGTISRGGRALGPGSYDVNVGRPWEATKVDAGSRLARSRSSSQFASKTKLERRLLQLPNPTPTLGLDKLKYSSGFTSRSPQRSLVKSATIANLGPGAYDQKPAVTVTRSTSLSTPMLEAARLASQTSSSSDLAPDSFSSAISSVAASSSDAEHAQSAP